MIREKTASKVLTGTVAGNREKPTSHHYRRPPTHAVMKRSFKLAFTPPKQAGAVTPAVVKPPVTVTVKRPVGDAVPATAPTPSAGGESRQPSSSPAPTAVPPPLPTPKKVFVPPSAKAGVVVTPKPAASAKVEESPAQPATAKYYIIMYTKFSTKKHKVYDDGILTLNGTHAIIQNMEGAWEIGVV